MGQIIIVCICKLTVIAQWSVLCAVRCSAQTLKKATVLHWNHLLFWYMSIKAEQMSFVNNTFV